VAAVYRALLIAFHFPPMRASGTHRTLGFCRHLPEFGWRPLVLTATADAWPDVSDDDLSLLPPDLRVERAPAFDASRRLSLAGRYPAVVAMPDRWWSWWPAAVRAGLGLIGEHRPSLIWSTSPIPTAHLIAARLQRHSGLPWVADFRDPMAQADWPSSALHRRILGWVERRTVESARRVVLTTERARADYMARYPRLPDGHWRVIANGYHEEWFAEAERNLPPRDPARPLTLLHSGVLYRDERDPRPFLHALAGLLAAGKVTRDGLCVVLRATGEDGHYRRLVKSLGLSDVVRVSPGLPYREALREMLAADGLLLFQGAGCHYQIPAKWYEYLRARRPVFACVDPCGDTAAELREAGVDTLVPLHDQAAIEEALPAYLRRLREGRGVIASPQAVESRSRRARSAELAALFDAVRGAPG